MRKNLGKAVVLGLSLTMVAGMAAGCGSSDKKSSSSSGKGSVYWLNFKPEANDALQSIAKQYKDETGVDVKVQTAASGEYEKTLTTEMDKGEDAPTMFVVGNNQGVENWGDFCYDLKDTDVYNQLNTDAFTLKDADGKVCSIGYCYESFGIIVNTELLEKAGHKLDEITNFESLKTVADDIHARAGELGFDAFTSSGMDDSSSWRFSGHLANMPLYYESKDDGGWTKTPATIKGTYLDNYKKIWDLYTTDTKYAKDTLASGGYDAEAEFIKGEAVFYQNGTWEYSALTKEKGEMDPAKLAMIPIYTGVEGEENIGLCSGTENCWAVNSEVSEDNIKATLDFMNWLVTSEAGTKMMAEQFGAIPYKAAAESENVFLQDANELANAGKETITWAFNYTPNTNEWRKRVVSAMNDYDNGKGDWDGVKAAFVDGWAAEYKTINQ